MIHYITLFSLITQLFLLARLLMARGGVALVTQSSSRTKAIFRDISAPK